MIGLPVSITPECAALLKIKTLAAPYYLDRVAKDEYAPDEYKLMPSGATAKRLLAGLAQFMAFPLDIDGVLYDVRAAAIPEVGWKCVELRQRQSP